MSLNWNFDSPLRTMCDAATNESDKALWEKENLGGITEDNNRMPMPVVLLVVLTVITAFFVTFPLWGQRPNAAIYSEYVRLMNTPEIMAIQDDKVAIAKIMQLSKGVHKGAAETPHGTESGDWIRRRGSCSCGVLQCGEGNSLEPPEATARHCRSL